MIRPRNLSAGDTICILAPSRKVSREQIEFATGVLRDWGLNVVFGAHTFSDEHGYLASSDRNRVKDFNEAILDDSVHAIIAARGGYGLTRIVDQLIFESLTKQPKWIVGFSDITALHLAMLRHDLVSIHGTMPLLFNETNAEQSLSTLKQILFSNDHQHHFNGNESNRPGEGKGLLIGGNLSLIVESLGTKTEIETDDCILVIEEIDEYKYKLDRMLHQLKRAGKLSKLAGLVVGYMTDIKDSTLAFGESIEEIVRNVVNEYSYPVAFNFPCGHAQPNLAFIHGGLYFLSVNLTATTLASQSRAL